ncbi:general secretion pathway protein C [Catenovulum agarivorans DS-2]|uniref:General secretion pathway protein C n=1 Tax=Catenovulum agarivorans DS-2 TaxID=1328313 RepID=W7QEB8_9ALTE|nr:type II secretion system protein GspC [Catenovulum agarivorans]EWH11229.1 general secretion pathway protein C [Catenovulum agarivorans DS-2]
MQDKIHQGLELAKKLPQQKFSLAVSLLLLIYIAWLLANITWKLFPQPNAAAINLRSASTAAANTVVADINRITNLNLFGDYSAAPVVQTRPVEDAPVTTLNLKLTGVVPSSDPELAAAIIEKSGSQDVYGLDEKIDGTRAVVREIYPDRIIIEQSSRRETLMLEGQEYSALAAESAQENNQTVEVAVQPDTTDQANISGEDKEALENLREDAFADPGKLVDYIKVSPVRRQGELVGYRLYPGKDPKLFQSVGLNAGDIAIEINGYDLTNLSQAMQAMAQLKDAQEASIMVERDGSVRQIFISLY